eukprot:13522726-Ditylum_brightwellii.AAC.1
MHPIYLRRKHTAEQEDISFWATVTTKHLTLPYISSQQSSAMSWRLPQKQNWEHFLKCQGSCSNMQCIGRNGSSTTTNTNPSQ